MARTKSYDEAVVLEAAVETFWSQGFEATSIDDLTAATGLSRSSMYQAFGNKRAFFGAALQHYISQRVDRLLADLEAESSGLATVREFFEHVSHVAVTWPDRFSLGCLLTNSMTELGAGDNEVQATGQWYVNRLSAAFRNALEQAESDGEVSRGQVEPRAEMLATFVLGMFVRSRGDADPKHAVAMVDSVLAVIDTWTI